jgi:hypothetical protein
MLGQHVRRAAAQRVPCLCRRLPPLRFVIWDLSFVMQSPAIRHAFCLRFAHDMVPEFPSLLPRGVTVAQVTLDHFVMVRIHARQVVHFERLVLDREALTSLNLW